MHHQKVSNKVKLYPGEMSKVVSNRITANKTKCTQGKQKQLYSLSRYCETHNKRGRLCAVLVSFQSLAEEQCENCHLEAAGPMKHFAPPRDRKRMKINTFFVTRQIVFDIWRSAMQDNYSKWHWPALTYHYNSRSAGREWKHLNGMELFVFEV